MKTGPDLSAAPALARLSLLAALWWLLTGGDARSWLVGAPVVLAATALSLHLRPARSWRWRLAGVLPMGWFFLRESVRGGFDVARRAIHPGLPVNPGVLRFDTRLPDGSPRLFFAGVISLLPGTLVLDLEENALRIHVLNIGREVEPQLEALEHRVAALFGIDGRGSGKETP